MLGPVLGAVLVCVAGLALEVIVWLQQAVVEAGTCGGSMPRPLPNLVDGPVRGAAIVVVARPRDVVTLDLFLM